MGEEDITRLFNKMVKEGGGIPAQLVRCAPEPPPPEWQEVAKAVQLAYKDLPEPYDWTYDGTGWSGQGGGSGYGPCGDQAAMMAMFQAMKGKMKGKGFDKGKGCDGGYGQGKGYDGGYDTGK